MRTCHQKLLPVASLLFITLVVTPASAFDNPNTGRWLNRDPQNENGGANLFAFADGAPLDNIDSLGLLSVAVISHYEVPAEKMPDDNRTASTVTSMNPPSDYGRWETCAPGCKKRVGMDLWIKSEIFYFQGFSLTQRNAAGRTPPEHENGHVQIHIDKWGEPVQTDADLFRNKCMKDKCADAYWSWFIASDDYHRLDSRVANWEYEMTETAAGNTRSFQTELRKRQNERASSATRVNALVAAIVEACK